MGGEHIGSHTPYGYKLDPSDKKRWVVDEEAAEYVRKIFQWYLAGFGPSHSAQKLRDKVDTPTHRGLKLSVKPTVKPPDLP
jgi:hypothetical protein